MVGRKGHTMKGKCSSKKRKERGRKAIQARWSQNDSAEVTVSGEINSEPGTSSSSTTVSDPSTDINVRLQGLENALSSDSQNNHSKNPPKYMIVDMNCLDDLVKNIPCVMCGNKTLLFDVSNIQGYACRLTMKCSMCGCENSSAMSSSRVTSDISQRAPFDVNRRVVQSFSSLGKGRSAMEQFSGILNMNTLSRYSYNEHVKAIHSAGNSAIESSLEKIREEVKKENRKLSEDEHSGGDVVDIGVSFDGSWMKRGHTSLYGIGCVIDLLTGYVIDFEVISKYCQACTTAKKELGENSPEFYFWKEGHVSDCQQNYEGSSGGMEAVAAERLWKRSLDFGLRYTTLLSDGDSKTFIHLQNLKIYGSVELKKEECINHVAKRLRTGLIQASKQHRLGGKKHGSLTGNTIIRLQKYYANAIRNNKNDITAMKTAVLATLHHCSSTDEKPFHRKCPTGPDTWCFYNKAIALGMQPGSHQKHIHAPLSAQVLQKIIPVYQRLAANDLLERCLEGRTQNSNECLHSMVWNRCPKETFVSKRKVDLAVASAVAEFNKGYREMVTRTLEEGGMSPGEQLQDIGWKREEKRVQQRQHRSSQKFKRYRSLVKMAKTRQEAAIKVKEGCSYEPGAF